jgi:tRNA threonylcarbamoyladenosine biosynthesis protein TsaE
MFILNANSEQAQEAIGARLAAALQGGCVIYLYGDLGAGKTTLARGLVHGLGYEGRVKSPTYTLLEPYQVGSYQLLHLDLYRLADPIELDYLGLRDLAESDTVWLVEWPERGGAELPAADVQVTISYHGHGRQLTFTAHSDTGTTILARLAECPAPND